jgi:5-hydroxyisourate hydrolase-like protein (transthyretin family)
MKLRLQAPLPRCRWAAATALAVTVAGSPFVVAGAAQAAGTGEVDIYVGDSSTGADVSGQTVSLYSTTTGAVVGASKTTDSFGSVEFTGLPAGGYTAKVAASSKYREKYSTVVTVTGDDDVEYNSVYVNPTATSYARLSGSVTQTGTPSLDAEVEIFPSTATEESILSGETQPIARAQAYDYEYSSTDQDSQADWGAYLAPGSYKVLVGDKTSKSVWHDDPESSDEYDGWSEFQSEHWVGAGSSDDADHATSFTVTAGHVRDTGTVALAPRDDSSTADSRISGTVTGTGGAKLGDVRVELFQQQDDGSWQEVNETQTDAKGRFGFSGTYDYDSYEEAPLPAGTYTLSFRDERREYASEFLGDVQTDDVLSPPEDAATVELGAQGSQTADASLSVVPVDSSTGAHGTVGDDTGKAHAGYVLVVDAYGNYVNDVPTRRDGTWSLPNTDLAPGSYKVYADDDVDVAGWYGGKSFKTARTYNVPIKGVADLGGSRLARFASITGRVTVPAIAGLDAVEGSVTVYDADGDEIDRTRLGSDGTYRIKEEPGTYYVSSTAWRYDYFDETAVGASWVPFIRQFWAGKYTIGTATPITVGSGATASNVNITLGRTLAATTAPSISGTAKAGSRLTATDGTWNVGHDVAFSYTWKRNGVVVGHAKTYALTTADQGTTLTLTVTATDTNLEYLTGTASAKPVAVAKPAPAKHHKKKHHKKKHKKHKK